MTNIFIIHGVGGSDKENWFPWIKQELEAQSYKVFIPNFPTPQGQTFENWQAEFAHLEGQITPDSILIGHSLGTLFSLHIAEKHQLKAFISVGGFGRLPNNEFDSGMKTFAKDFDWEQIRQNCQTRVIFHGDNDPYVTMEVAQQLAKDLGTEPIIIPNGGHLNRTSGFTKFPQLLAKIRSLPQ